MTHKRNVLDKAVEVTSSGLFFRLAADAHKVEQALVRLESITSADDTVITLEPPPSISMTFQCDTAQLMRVLSPGPSYRTSLFWRWVQRVAGWGRGL